MVPIRKNLLPESLYSWKSPYTMIPTRIVVHNTANDASADNEIKYMLRDKSNGVQVSYHYAVDDKEIVQGLPENRNGWHAGDGSNGKGNREGIAIEICYSKSGGDRFIKAEQNAVDLIVDILKRYGWGIDKVTKHQDYMNKYCPHRTLDMGWDRFINMIKEKMGETTTSPTSQNVNVYYKVKTQKHGWLGEIKNCNANDPVNGYAGWENSPVIGLALKVDKGTVKYRVHVKGGNWLGWITKYDISDYYNGYAGNNKPIDAVQIYYYTPDDIRPYKKAVYKVNNYGWQHDTETKNGQDGYAGLFGNNVTKLQVTIE